LSIHHHHHNYYNSHQVVNNLLQLPSQQLEEVANVAFDVMPTGINNDKEKRMFWGNLGVRRSSLGGGGGGWLRVIVTGSRSRSRSSSRE